VDKLYESFVSVVKKICNAADAELLFMIAISVLGTVLFYEVLMMVVIMGVKRRGGCGYNSMQINNMRRWTVLTLAWFFTAFCFLNLIPFDGGIATVSMHDIVLPVVFILFVYMLELFFSMITYTKCTTPCHGKHSKEAIAAVEATEELIREEQKAARGAARGRPIAPAAEIVEERSTKAMNAEMKEAGNISRAFAPEEEKAISEVSPIDTSVVAAVSTAMHRRPGVRKAPGTGTRATKPRAVKKTPEEIEAEKKKERIEELGAKIERQRRQAERSADTVDSVNIPYAAGTEQARSRVEETANKMDELQRRMDTLRKTVTVRDVNAPEPVQQNERKAQSDTRTITELRREQDRLKYQYETLQHKLEQIANEKTNVGYYSGANNFEKTGKSENLSKIPSRNKFDEEEVKSALMGLKNAIDDLQRKIDARGE
jgi:hypothetical protein